MPGKPLERFGFEPRGGEVREGGSSVGWGRGRCCFPTVHCQCPAPSPGHTEWLQKEWPVLVRCCGRIHRDNLFGKLTAGSTRVGCLLSVYPGEVGAHVRQGSPTPAPTATLFVISPRWKQPSVHQRETRYINSLCCSIFVVACFLD